MKNNSYDDIINLPHPVSKNHPQMPLRDRAAQFAPFAALTGHDAAIKETARLTDERLELSEEVIALKSFAFSPDIIRPCPPIGPLLLCSLMPVPPLITEILQSADIPHNLPSVPYEFQYLPYVRRPVQ